MHRTSLIFKGQRVHVEVVPWHISAPDPALLVRFGLGVLWTEGLLNNAHRSSAQGYGFVDLALCGGGDALDQKRKMNLSWNAHSSAIHHHPQQHAQIRQQPTMVFKSTGLVVEAQQQTQQHVHHFTIFFKSRALVLRSPATSG